MDEFNLKISQRLAELEARVANSLDNATPSGAVDSRLDSIERFINDMRSWRMVIPKDGAAGGVAPTPTVTSANSGLYLNGTTVQLGTNPLLENVAIDGASAFSIDFPNMVNFSTDVTTAVNMTRDAFSGTYSIFNDVTSPVISGSDAVGVSWEDADEILASFVARQTGESTNSYVNTTSGITSKISATPSSAFINYVNTISFENLIVDVGPNGINLLASQTTNSTEIEVTPFQILVDAKSKLFKLNEGTTDTGTSTAENGMSLKLVDKTTGEAKYGNVTVPAFETVQGVGNPTAIVFVTGLPGERNVPFVDIVHASTHITLNAGGDIDINTTGKYIFTLDTTWQAASGAPASRFAINAKVNAVDDFQTVAAFSVSTGGGASLRHTSQTFILDLTSGDNVAFVAKRINGGATITSLAGCRLTANLIG